MITSNKINLILNIINYSERLNMNDAFILFRINSIFKEKIKNPRKEDAKLSYLLSEQQTSNNKFCYLLYSEYEEFCKNILFLIELEVIEYSNGVLKSNCEEIIKMELCFQNIGLIKSTIGVI